MNKAWFRPVLIILGCVSMAVALTAMLYLGYIYVKAGQTIDKISAQHPPDEQPITEQPQQPGYPEENAEPKPITDKDRPLLFLLTAIDHRPGSGGSLNTDVIMLAAWEPQAKSITLLSIPRDMKMQPPGFNPHKANYYYAYYYNRDKDTAIRNTKSLFSGYLDLPIDHMAIINFEGFRDLVDLLGGTTIDVEIDMRYIDPTDGTDINLQKGLQKLDGKNTLDYLRYRKSNQGTAESSDAERNQRQQVVLQQLIDKLTSFNGLTKLDRLLDIIGDNLQTDVPAHLIREWIFNASKLKPNHFTTLQVDSQWISPYILVDEEQWEEALQQLRELVNDPKKPSVYSFTGDEPKVSFF